MGCCYCSIIDEANSLMDTFTISYNVSKYEGELFSSTYDELSGWVRKTLQLIESDEELGRDSDIYKYIRKYRGRAGDITLIELQHIVKNLEDIKSISANA
jgi:hypothetical protein